LSTKSPVISRPQFHLSLLEVSLVVVEVGAPAGASGNFQSRVGTISLQGCGTSGGISHRGRTEEEEEEEEELYLYCCIYVKRALLLLSNRAAHYNITKICFILFYLEISSVCSTAKCIWPVSVQIQTI
jgi:hypothetical protein